MVKKCQKKARKKITKKENLNSHLKTMVIAYEFSKCHGYGIKESEVSEMWEETIFEEGSVDTSGIGAYSGMRTDEISNAIAREVLK